ncbi:MAG: PAS domain S-box protein [bacterium]|nr:PAS domain S-box protein [bacterium]
MGNLDSDLSSLKRLSEAIIESLGDGVLIVDKNGLVHKHNKRFREMWGIEPLPNGVQGALELARMVQNQMLFPDEFLQTIKSFETRDDAAEHFDLLEFKDGRVFERRQRSLRHQGLNLGRLLVFRDVTREKELEAASKALTLQVQTTQRLESLGVLAGGLAHEFNNILMVIMGNADILDLEIGALPKVKPHLSEIFTASRKAADLCDQMHSYAGKGNTLKENLDLSCVIKEMTGILDITMGKKVDLVCNFPEDLPDIKADVTKIRQLVLNLVGNAADACLEKKEGWVELGMIACHCDRSFLKHCLCGPDAEPGNYLCLKVMDTGCGIAQDQQQKVFDPFFSTKFAGRGLGLSAVLGIVRSLKGAVKLFSRPGEGSTFSIYLPVATQN